MSRAGRRAAPWFVALLVAGCALAAGALRPGPASAQENFRLTHEVDRSNPAQLRVTGTVFNDSSIDVLDVYVTAEALDAGGKIIARGVSYVTSTIPARGQAPFAIRVPPMPGISRVRVRVNSFRLGFGPQAG